MSSLMCFEATENEARVNGKLKVPRYTERYRIEGNETSEVSVTNSKLNTMV